MTAIKYTGTMFQWSNGTTPGSWYFIEIDAPTGNILKEAFGKRVGWGSIPVQVTIGKTQWKTSMFPVKNKSYYLPIKAEVRKKEKLTVDTSISLTISL